MKDGPSKYAAGLFREYRAREAGGREERIMLGVFGRRVKAGRVACVPQNKTPGAEAPGVEFAREGEKKA